MTKVGKHDAYVAEPKGSKKHDGVALLYIPDVIGIWENSKLMADQYAANGYYTMIIDPFNGDALALNFPEDFDFMKWLTQGSDGKNPHTKEAVDPIIVEALEDLKSKGFTKIGALGYCFGAKVRREWLSLLVDMPRADVSPSSVPCAPLQGRHQGWLRCPPLLRR